MSSEIALLVEQLAARQSPKRRAAARKLRTLKVAAAGPALLTALEREVADPRTWETQYQMVMALGECGYREALPLLEAFAQRPFEATMVYVAPGDAIVRLSYAGPSDVAPVLRGHSRHPRANFALHRAGAASKESNSARR